MKLIFMGSAPFAISALQKLIDSNHTIQLVVAQPDKPAGRGQMLTSPPTITMAKKMDLPIYQPTSLKTEDAIATFKNLNPDFIVVVAYGKFLPIALCNIPKLATINSHPSLLPKYRGPAPINWPIINGDTETGVTIMHISEEMDAGDIILQKKCEILKTDTSITMHDKLSEMGADLLVEAIDQISSGSGTRTKQNHSKATLAPILKKEDGHINWSQSAESVHNRIRGLQPWPGTFTHLDGKRLKIFGATITNENSTETPGTIMSTPDKIGVATHDFNLHLTDLQIEGKKRMTASEFLRGHEITIGTQLK